MACSITSALLKRNGSVAGWQLQCEMTNFLQQQFNICIFISPEAGSQKKTNKQENNKQKVK